MPIVFAANVPQWMRRQVRRWVRVLGYDDWSIEVRRATEDELREFVGCGAEDATMITAAAHPLPEYLSAELLFNEELDAAGAEDAIIHELLHCHLAPFTLLFEQLWDGRRKASKKQARAMLANLIEERIQRHVRQLQRARGRGGA